MLPVLAIPVLHSSGVWIASTAASGYVAGTLSGTWVGAFILGNSGFLSSIGLISAAGWIGASGAIASMATSSAAIAGSALSAIGMGGFAQSIGIIPATFLGLTPVGWMISGAAAGVAASLGYLVTRRALKKINEERQKGGLEPTNLRSILKEIRAHEDASKFELLKRAAASNPNWQISNDKINISINDEVFPIKRTRFVVDQDRTASFVVTGRFNRVLRTFRIDPRLI